MLGTPWERHVLHIHRSKMKVVVAWRTHRSSVAIFCNYTLLPWLDITWPVKS